MLEKWQCLAPKQLFATLSNNAITQCFRITDNLEAHDTLKKWACHNLCHNYIILSYHPNLALALLSVLV